MVDCRSPRLQIEPLAEAHHANLKLQVECATTDFYTYALPRGGFLHHLLQRGLVRSGNSVNAQYDIPRVQTRLLRATARFDLLDLSGTTFVIREFDSKKTPCWRRPAHD